MKTIYLLLSGILYLSSALSVAHGKDYGEGQQNFTESKVLKNKDGLYDHWRGIGRLITRTGYCTATLLDTQDPSASLPTPAYVLTSGHCTELTNANIVTNTPIQGFMQFNYFTDTAPLNYVLKNIAWRSIQGVDMAIIELDVSLQTLLKKGIQPLRRAINRPADGTDVLIVGAPYGFDEETLRLSACTLQPAGEIVEGRWVWRNTFMTRCKDMKGGGSGSPVLDRQTNEIIGVIGTGNLDDKAAPCEQMAPCTPEGGGYKAILGNVYGNPTDFLNRCFVAGHLVQDATAHCSLFPVFSVSAAADSPQRYRRVGKKDDGNADIPTWNYRFSIDTPFYRHKTVRSAMDCEKALDYSSATSANDAFINTEIGEEPGIYFLCILGIDSMDQRPEVGLINNTLALPVEILANTPTAKAELTFITGVQAAANELPYRTYASKFGPIETTDCSDTSQYITSTDLYSFFEDSDLPGKLCTIAYDISGQASEPRVDILFPNPQRLTGVQGAP